MGLWHGTHRHLRDIGLADDGDGRLFHAAVAGRLRAHSQLPDGPIWLGVAIGFVFFAGGCSVIIKAIYGDLDSQSGDAPAGAPAIVRVLYYAFGVGIVAGLGALFTWISIGPGERQFSGSGAFLGPLVGRAMFGLGALMAWLFLGLSIRRWLKGRGESS